MRVRARKSFESLGTTFGTRGNDAGSYLGYGPRQVGFGVRKLLYPYREGKVESST